MFTITPAADTKSFMWDTNTYLTGGSVNASMFRVGDADGTGTFTLDLTPQPTTGTANTIRSNSSNFGLGVGIGGGSKGAATVLGTGKTPTQMGAASYNGAYMGSRNQASTIGGAGGNGSLTINGAGLTLMTTDPNDFVVGDGAGSVGSVDILKSGKLGAGNPAALYDSLSYGKNSQAIIGNNSGVGKVTVHDDATSAFPNQANFMMGVTVGNQGGNGTLDVLAGGKAYAGSSMDLMGACTAASHPAALQISPDSASTGIVRAVGAAAQVLVGGKMTFANGSTPTEYGTPNIGTIEISTGGSLVTTDSAVVKVGVSNTSQQPIDPNDPNTGTYLASNFYGGLGPIKVNNDGQVAYGSENPASPLAPGSIEAYSINLQGSTSTLRFNHTGSVNVEVPVLGVGQIVQNAGNTTITGKITPVTNPPDMAMAPGCPPDISNPPTDQSGFAGSLKVSGGKLTLPINNVLPNVKATTISNGTLFMGNTTQNLGAVTMSGGVLDLSGGLNKDVVNATSWNGTGGLVKLDTILGATGNTSDVIHITGPITGTTTRLQINVIGGQGALTTGNGIPVVLADTDPSSVATHFQLESIVSDNGFDYSLKLVNGNWYLQSTATPTTPPPPPPPMSPTPVPTMSTFGLMGMGTLLAAMSGFMLRRRKPELKAAAKSSRTTAKQD